MIFLNSTHPYLSIFVPATGEYVRFVGGKLEMDETDPRYPVVAAEAARNPNIVVLSGGVQCPECGEPFVGTTAKAQLGSHRKNIHFDKWVADKEAEAAAAIQTEVKARAGYACDVCVPAQVFGDADSLAAHVAILHTAAPELDDEGNGFGGESDERRPGEVDPVPAAKRGKHTE